MDQDHFVVALNGRGVISFVLPGVDVMVIGREDECMPKVIDCAGKGYDRMVYYCENLGEYGIDWICCYKGNVLAAQYNARYVESITFVKEPLDEDS